MISRLFSCLIISIILSAFLYFRYLSWGIPSSGIVPFVFIVSILVLLFFFSIRYYGRVLNPCSAYLFFIFLFAYSIIPISDSLLYTNKLLFIIISGVFFYLLGLAFPIKYKLLIFKCFSIRSKRYILYLLVFLSLFSFLYEVRNIGYIPILAIGRQLNIYGDVGEAMSFLHTFVLLAPVIIFWVMILGRQDVISKKEKNILLCVLYLIFVNNFGRTSLLMFALIGFIYLDYYYKFNLIKILTGLSLFVFAFVAMGNLRSGSTTEAINQILRNIAKTKYETSIMESYLASYSSVNFYKMNDLIKKKEELNYFSYGKNALKPACKLLRIQDDSVEEFQTQTNLTTYLADPYLDFGFIGVLIFNYLYAYTAQSVFFKYRDAVSEEYVVSWGLILFCIFMMCFFNAFNTMLVWVTYFFNKILLKK